MQARSRQELADALRRRDVPGEVADAVLHRMQEVGLINDESFAEGWVESRQQRRYLSKSVLRRELRDKGVERELIEDAMAHVGPEQEFAAALALAEKKLRSLSRLDQRIQRRRVAGALARRGFTAATVGDVLAQVFGTDPLTAPEDADDGAAP